MVQQHLDRENRGASGATTQPAAARSMPSGSGPQRREGTLADLMQPLWRRRRFLLLWVLVGTGLASLYILNLTPRYLASAMVMLDTRQLHYAEMRSVLTGPASGIDASVVRSEVEIILSEGLARRVVRELDLIHHRDFMPRPPLLARLTHGLAWSAEAVGADSLAAFLSQAAGSLTPPIEDDEKRIAAVTAAYRGILGVFTDGRSYVINVSFQSSDPVLAARIVNRHVEFYIEDQRRMKNEALASASQWLDREVDSLAMRLRAAEQAVQDFREEHQLFSPRGTSLIAQQLSEMNQQLADARGDLTRREARLRRAGELHDRGAVGDSQTDVQSSMIISRLRDLEAAAQLREADAASRYGDRHPALQAARAEVREIRRKTQEEVEKVLRGLQSEVDIARAREATLRGTVAHLEESFAQIERNEAQARDLERQAAAVRSLYENLLVRRKEVAAQEGIQQADARVVSRASTPLWPNYPRTKLFFGIALLGSVVSGASIVLARERLRPTMASLAEAEAAAGTLGLCVVPRVPRNAPLHRAVLDRPKSAAAEAIRTLRMSLVLPRHGAPMRVLAVTSALPGEGKTSIALAMARSMAASGLNVLLIDADLRRPAIARLVWGQTVRQGLIAVLRDRMPLSGAVLDDPLSPLRLLPAEDSVEAPQDLLASRPMEDLLVAAAESYDYVVIDTPPASLVSDAGILGRMAHGTVLVARARATPRDTTQDAAKALVNAGARIAGVVLNRADLRHEPSHAAYRHGVEAGYFHG